MAELAETLDLVELVVFVALALATGWQWHRHRGAPAAWAAATFATLGVVVTIAAFLPADPEGGELLVTQAVVAVLVLFPYCLFRFATSLEPALPRLRWAALALTALVSLSIFAFDDLPAPGEPRTRALLGWSVAVLVQWGGLSVVVARRLWRAGTGRPTVVRRRMRTLSAGAVGLVVILATGVAVPADGDADELDVAVGLATIAIGPLFAIGLVPPRALVARWRRPEEEALYKAEVALMAATSPDEVAAGLLPHIAATLGSRRVRLVDVEGRETAVHGDEPVLSVPLPAVPGTSLSVPMRSGALTVEADPYAPFFGRDGTELLRRLAALTDIALRRAEVSERERAMALELTAANDTMREFVAVASHDLRTPISVVKGYAELLVTAGAGMTEAERTAHLRTIARQADHLSTIVEDLLTVSRIDSGGLVPDPAPVALASVARDVVRDLGVGFAVAVDIGDDVVASVDLDHAARMVRNLVENACTYGDAPILVSGTVAGDGVELRVRDHGRGVPEAFRSRLFGRFARDDASKQRAKQGTGLGLSIVRGLARAGGGDAWFEPADPGACFAIRLPRATVGRSVPSDVVQEVR